VDKKQSAMDPAKDLRMVTAMRPALAGITRLGARSTLVEAAAAVVAAVVSAAEVAAGARKPARKAPKVWEKVDRACRAL
jgi:hypothetical protein